MCSTLIELARVSEPLAAEPSAFLADWLPPKGDARSFHAPTCHSASDAVEVEKAVGGALALA
jgi:hypothetical protein